MSCIIVCCFGHTNWCCKMPLKNKTKRTNEQTNKKKNPQTITMPSTTFKYKWYSLLIWEMNTEVPREVQFLIIKSMDFFSSNYFAICHWLFSHLLKAFIIFPASYGGAEIIAPCSPMKCLEHMEALLCERLRSQNLFA